MAAKKKIRVKFEGEKVDGNRLNVRIPESVHGRRHALNHRAMLIARTGVRVEVDPGYRLRFSLVPELADKGMIAVGFTGIEKGEVVALLINVGRRCGGSSIRGP